MSLELWRQVFQPIRRVHDHPETRDLGPPVEAGLNAGVIRSHGDSSAKSELSETDCRSLRGPLALVRAHGSCGHEYRKRLPSPYRTGNVDGHLKQRDFGGSPRFCRNRSLSHCMAPVAGFLSQGHCRACRPAARIPRCSSGRSGPGTRIRRLPCALPVLGAVSLPHRRVLSSPCRPRRLCRSPGRMPGRHRERERCGAGRSLANPRRRTRTSRSRGPNSRALSGISASGSSPLPRRTVCATGRLFNCKRCRRVVLCRSCDRGQDYCSRDVQRTVPEREAPRGAASASST